MIKLIKLLQEQTLKSGMRDPNVGSKDGPIAKLQSKLIQLGFMKPIPSSSYGIYGPKTKASVLAFQKDVFPGQPGEHDGIAGTKTLGALNNKLKKTTSRRGATSITAKYIESLYSATGGIGTKVPELYKVVKSIKNKDILNQINKVLQSNQRLYDENPPNTMVTLSDGSKVNSDWLKGYTSVQAIVDGELGIFDRTRKNQLNYHLKILKDPKILSGTGWAIGLSWPTYQPGLPAAVKQSMKYIKVDNAYTTIGKAIFGDDFKPGSVGKLGHGGVAVIKPDGNVYLAEFGRYVSGKSMEDGKKWFLTQPEGREFAKAFEEKEGRPVTTNDIPADAVAGYGVVKKKSLGKIARIENGKITNFDSILIRLKANSQGDGKKLPMQGVLVRGYDWKSGLQFINSFTTREYTFVDIGTGGGSNCATFMIDTMIAGKIPGLQGACYPNISFNFNVVAASPNAVATGDA